MMRLFSLRAFVTAACVDRDGRRCVLRARFRRIRRILFVKDRAAAFIAYRTARIPPLSDAAHVPSHGNLTKTFDFDPQKDARRELLVAAAQARKAATAALHNKRVNEQRSSAIRMKTTIEHYTRSTINRRLKVRSRIES